MNVKELREKLSHYPPNTEVVLQFDDILEYNTWVSPGIYRDSFSIQNYDHTNRKIFISPTTFNTKYIEIYEQYIKMKQDMKKINLISERYEEE